MLALTMIGVSEEAAGPPESWIGKFIWRPLYESLGQAEGSNL